MNHDELSSSLVDLFPQLPAKRGALSLRRSKVIAGNHNTNQQSALSAQLRSRKKVNPADALEKLPTLQNHLGDDSFFAEGTSARVNSFVAARKILQKTNFPVKIEEGLVVLQLGVVDADAHFIDAPIWYLAVS